MKEQVQWVELTDRELTQVHGGAVPLLLVVPFLKGFGAGVTAAAAVDIAYQAIDKMSDR